MLKRLYVDNYKCLVNFEFRPSPFQLVLGGNGSGKSTMLEVLTAMRDMITGSKSAGEAFSTATRTRWQNVPLQRFELEVDDDSTCYRYALVLETATRGEVVRVAEETLHLGKKTLFTFNQGEASLYNDADDGPKATLFLDRSRSGLAIVEARHDNTMLSRFKSWLARTTVLQLNPWGVRPTTSTEAAHLEPSGANFADWYRHLALESPSDVGRAMGELADAIPGFESLLLREAGQARVLEARFSLRPPEKVDLPLSVLSQGQCCLAVLYVLLHASLNQPRLLIIDEPDNFLALSEIQPWLLKLRDAVEERGAQAILISHHPELMNQMAHDAIIFDRPDGYHTVLRPFPESDTGLTPAEVVARGWDRA